MKCFLGLKCSHASVQFSVLAPPHVMVLYIAGSALDKITASLSDLKTRLDSRKCIAPDVFAENMKLRQETHHLGKNLMYIIPSPRAKF